MCGRSRDNMWAYAGTTLSRDNTWTYAGTICGRKHGEHRAPDARMIAQRAARAQDAFLAWTCRAKSSIRLKNSKRTACTAALS